MFNSISIASSNGDFEYLPGTTNAGLAVVSRCHVSLSKRYRIADAVSTVSDTFLGYGGLAIASPKDLMKFPQGRERLKLPTENNASARPAGCRYPLVENASVPFC